MFDLLSGKADCKNATDLTALHIEFNQGQDDPNGAQQDPRWPDMGWAGQGWDFPVGMDKTPYTPKTVFSFGPL